MKTRWGGKEEDMPHSENLLSQKEVAKRWGCDTSTIARREKDGVIKKELITLTEAGAL